MAYVPEGDIKPPAVETASPPYKEIAQDYERRLYAFWDENERLRKAAADSLVDLMNLASELSWEEARLRK